jgi:hypothetical protein
MLNNLQAEIEKSAKKVVKKIRLYAPTDQGDLRKSVKYVITDDGFEVDALPYLDYIDKGVNGIKKSVGSIYSYTLKKPPIKSLKGWSKRKGLNPYAVQNSLYYNGLKPKRFLRKADEEFDVDSLVVAYGKDIEEQMFNW